MPETGQAPVIQPEQIVLTAMPDGKLQVRLANVAGPARAICLMSQATALLAQQMDAQAREKASPIVLAHAIPAGPLRMG